MIPAGVSCLYFHDYNTVVHTNLISDIWEVIDVAQIEFINYTLLVSNLTPSHMTFFSLPSKTLINQLMLVANIHHVFPVMLAALE